MGLKDTYSASDLATLTPDELSALEADDGSNADVLNEIAAGGAEEGAAAAAATTGAAAASPAAAAAAATPAAQAAAPAATPAPAAAPAASTPSPAPSPTAVVYDAKVQGDVAKDILAQKDAIKAARASEQEALKKLNDGEIDFDAYSKVRTDVDSKIDAANDKILDLHRAQARAEVSVELTAQQQQNAWRTMLNEHIADAKKGGIDYLGDEKLKGEFNSLLRAFAIEASDRGMVDGADMGASRWALDQAAQIMRIRHPAATPAPAPAAGSPAAAPAATPAAAPATPAAAAGTDLGGLKTIGGMPAAAAAPVSDDVMSKIGTLEGDELEVYLASLPKDVYNRITSGV